LKEIAGSMNQKSHILYLKAEMSHFGSKSFEGLYRVIAIKDDRSFRELAKVIITSFDLDFDNEYGFYKVDDEGVETGAIFTGDAGTDSEEPVSIRSIIGSVFRKKCQKSSFLYGKQNQWRFSVELVKIIEGCDTIKLPAIVQSCGEVPPPLEDFIYHS